MNKTSYLSFNRFLKERFGERVQKIPLDAGLGCPNRDGTKGRGGCIYCDPNGSGTGAAAKKLSIKDQMEAGIIWAERRYGARLYLPYFQSFSNTYAPLDVLERIYSEALAFKGVAGIAIGTRPDCVSEDVLGLIHRLAGNRMVWMEYGLQSASNATLDRINRRHTVEDFISCVKRTKTRGMLVCAHVIFGLPGEKKKEMMDTVSLLADLEVEGVKFHNLYLVPGTALWNIYQKEPFTLISQEEYADMVAKAITILPEGTVIQRVTGDPPRDTREALPLWSRDKHATIRMIEQKLSGLFNR